MVFPQVETAIRIPIIHIADPTAEAIRQGWNQKSEASRNQSDDGGAFLQGSALKSIWDCR